MAVNMRVNRRFRKELQRTSQGTSGDRQEVSAAEYTRRQAVEAAADDPSFAQKLSWPPRSGFVEW
jgi:hypothetical protein